MGSIDANTLPDFRKQIQGFTDKGRKFLVLKSTGLKYVNSSGLGALIKMASELQQEGGQFAMFDVPDKIFALFKMLGILDVVKVYPSETETFAAIGTLAEPKPTPKHFPLMIRCIACRKKIELPAAGYFRCPRCGACFSVKPEGKVKGYQIDQPQSIELRLPCMPDSSPAIQEASASLARLKDYPSDEWENLKNVLEKSCTLAWRGATPEETCSVYIVSDRKEFRAAIKVDHAPFDTQGELQSIRPLVDEMDIISLPSGAQILKFTRKVNRSS
jgi:anti-anti-sigma factor